MLLLPGLASTWKGMLIYMYVYDYMTFLVLFKLVFKKSDWLFFFFKERKRKKNNLDDCI